MECEPLSQIAGLLQEISTRDSTKNLTLHLTLPLCNHQLYVPATGMAPTILTSCVEMLYPETGQLIVKVGPCGLTRPTAGLLNRLWRKLTLK